MGKPAARLGDMTAHGGSIVMGLPTVLIGGMPAARVGDMHVCPMVTPGVPPIPHVGGPILPPGGIGVLIGGMPAARLGDMAVCVGPPSTIILGCMTVLIGETGGGGGGGGGGGAGAGGGSAAAGAVTSSSIAGTPETEEISDHYIDFNFEDKAKLPVGGMRYTLTYPDNSKAHGWLGKQIKRTGVPEGSYTVELRAVVDAQWSVKNADVGTAVDLKVDTIGVANGEKALLEIFVRDGNYTDHRLEVIEAQVSGDKVQEQWTMQVDEKYLNICEAKGKKKKYSQPFFFFKVSIGELCEQSGLLYIQDWVEVELKDVNGKGLANQEYMLNFCNGEVKNGRLDNSGKAKEVKVPPSKCTVNFSGQDELLQ